MSEFDRYKQAAPLCEKHQPSGGTRSACLVCAIEKLESALSRIDYACGKPNEMGISDYDTHYCEEVVVERVKDRIGKVAGALKELLRLYDWRFKLAEIERADPPTHNRKDLEKLLRQYGEEKKAAWKVAREVLS